MTVWGALAGGFVGTLVLTTILRASSEMRLTRIDLPFLLGTVVTKDRLLAKLIGYVFHALFGFAFAVGYFLILSAIGKAGALPGALLGLLHGAVVSTIALELLPIIHPRMGTLFTSAGETALLEPPGFLMLNYGRATPAVTIVAHVCYGAIVGWFTAHGV